MARASTGSWQCIAVVLMLSTGAVTEARWAPLATLSILPGQTSTGAQAALNQGIECYRKGDYSDASVALGQAQADRLSLSASEQQELDNWSSLNRQALRNQLAGHDQLRKAEIAVRNGRPVEASSLIQAVRRNPFVSASDKRHAEMLASQLQSVKTAAPGKEIPRGSMSGVQARTKLRQARAMMTHGNFDAALALAQEASQLPAVYQPGEDTPGRVLEDIHEAQSDSRALLAAARAAFHNGDLDSAERLAHQADHASYAWTFMMRGDTPDRVLADVQIERRRQAARTGSSFPTPASAPASAPVMTTSASLMSGPTVSETPANVAAPAAPALQLSASVSLSGAAATQPVQVASAGPGVPDTNPSPAASNQVFDQGRGVELHEEAQVAGELHMPTNSIPAPTTASAVVAQGTAPPPADSRKAQAQILMKQAHELQRQERLIEAYEKVVEAQKLAATFQLAEENPAAFRLELCAQATRKMEKLMDQANSDAAAAKTAEARKHACDKLAEARLLAIGFGLDCQPIDVRLTALQKSDEAAAPVSAPATHMLPPVDPKTAFGLATGQVNVNVGVQADLNGQQLLDLARREIRAGHNEKARALTERAFQGPYGVKAEAEALLRTICAEEYKQRCRASETVFDAGVKSYQRKDYATARQCFAGVDVSALSPEHRDRLRGIMAAPEMQPHDIIQASAHSTTVEQPGKATASDTPGKSHIITPEQNYAKEFEAQQQLEFQKLRWDGTLALRHALERMQAQQLEQALGVLEDYLAQLKDSHLDSEKVALLRRPIDIRLDMIRKMRAEIAAEQDRDASRINWAKKHNEQIHHEMQKEQEVAALMDQYRTLYKAGKYAEALQQAEKAHELDPDNYVVAAAVRLAETRRNKKIYDDYKKEREDLFVVGLDEAEHLGPAVGDQNPLHVDPERAKLASHRKQNGSVTEFTLQRIHNDREKEIQSHLRMPVQISFNNTPLNRALAELSAENDINIVPDRAALEAENIRVDAPVSLQVEGIQLQSALNLLLNQVHLTYVIQNEVLLVTTNAKASDRLERKVYQVADLIVPIEDHGVAPTNDLETMLERSMPQYGRNKTAMPEGTTVVPGGQQITTSNGHGSTDATTQWAMATRNPSKLATAGQTIQDVLIELITNSIKPESWSKMGGPGTIDYYPLGMALIINQTPDIQEQIAQLLEALRKLQDLEVVVEVRFIELDEAFYERIGVDFGLNFTNRQTKYQPQLVTGNFAPPNFINAFMPSGFVSGTTAQSNGPQVGAVFTPDLGIPIQPGSFGPAVPPFGGFQNAAPDGGLQLGLAFLSDIQVYMLLEAAQADRRSNVMMAPKITMFNGQTSTVTVSASQFFVTNVQVIQDNGQLVFVPLNTPLPVGGPQNPTITLTVQTTVSADRRFVRMNLFPILGNLTSPVTGLFPITTFITPVFEGGSQGQPIPFTQYLQQPGFSTISVTTTVSVPDGGTVLLGGMKMLHEGRNEFGPPILSQLPYINRLFKNVGYGRDTSSLLLMVTPRIIINEEEEDLQINQGRGGILGGTSGPGGLGASRPQTGTPVAPPPPSGPGM